MMNEQKIISLVVSFLSLKFNIGIIIITLISWYVITFFGYYNQNFDMVSTVINYFIILSSVSLAASLITDKRSVEKIASLGVINFILSLLTILFVKNVSMNSFGHFVFLPLNIFTTLLLLKSIKQAIMLPEKTKK